MNAPVKLERAKPMRAVTFKAWRVSPDNPRNEAQPIDLPDVATAEEAAQAACLYRGEMVMVLLSDAAQRPERRHLLHIYKVKAKTNPARRWNTGSGKFEAAKPEYPSLIGMVCVGEGFSPAEPWKWTPVADVTGVDRTCFTPAKDERDV